MRITAKKIREVISHAAGDDVVELAIELNKNPDYSEFDLAENLEYDIKVVRNLLYRLQDINIVTHFRQKDKVKGWYIYYWTFRKERLKDLYLGLKKTRYLRLISRLNREENSTFYMCPNKCLRLDFDKAMGFDFKCIECGELMEPSENKLNIKDVKAEMKEIEKLFRTEMKISIKKLAQELLEKQQLA